MSAHAWPRARSTTICGASRTSSTRASAITRPAPRATSSCSCSSRADHPAVVLDPRRYLMAELPVPSEGILLTHFIVSDDVERSRRFYTDVLGGETIYAGEPSFVALANSWIII